MGAVYFYHLTERPLEATLPVLLSKALEAGWRVAVRGRSAEALARLDLALWAGDGFLPHGIAGGPHDALQPVLLTTGAAANGATCLMCVDGAPLDPAEIDAMERVCILFDGADAIRRDEARATWREVTQRGAQAQYWAEEGGRWIRKAESG